MEMTSLPPADGSFHLTGPLEPLPGHDDLILADPPPPPSVPPPAAAAPAVVRRRAVAKKRSMPVVTRPIVEEDDDSDEDDDDYEPPSAKARRIEEEERKEPFSSVGNSPALPPSQTTDQPAGAAVTSELTVAATTTVAVRRRKTMDDNVGPQYQAEVPDNPLPPEEWAKDQRRELVGELLWEPGIVRDEDVSRFLLAVDAVEDSLSVEKALELVRRRNYDYKAVTLDILYGPPMLDLHRRRRRDILSKAEQKQFKEALAVMGKNFHLIAKCMGRSVHDLMEYYYLWKKKSKFHVSIAHQEHICYVDAAIRPPRLTGPFGPDAGKAKEKGSSRESGESDSESSASCHQS